MALGSLSHSNWAGGYWVYTGNTPDRGKFTYTNPTSYLVVITSISLKVGQGVSSGVGSKVAAIDSSTLISLPSSPESYTYTVTPSSSEASGTLSFTGQLPGYPLTKVGTPNTKSGSFDCSSSTLTQFTGGIVVPAGATVTLKVSHTSGQGVLCTGYSSGWILVDEYLKCSCSSPSITDTSIMYGDSVTASASCGSGETLHYQWYKSDGTEISGATSASRTPTSVGEYCKIYSSRSGYFDSDPVTTPAVSTVKLRAPKDLSYPTEVMYGGSVTATASISTPAPSGSYLTFSWSSGESGATLSKVTSTGLTCQVIVQCSGGFTNSDSVTGSPIDVKLNEPSGATAGYLYYNQSLSNLTKSASEASSNPTVSEEWQYRTSTSASWSSWSSTAKITSSYVYLRVRYTKTGYISSDWVSVTSGNTKLNKPGAPSVSPDPVTVDLSVTATSAVDPGAIASYSWYKSGGSQISGQTSSTYTTNYSDGSGIYAKVQAVRSGYVSSDVSSASNSVDVYFEPRSMSLNGFKVQFSPESLVIPGANVYSTWNDFKPSLNLGRFNYYVLQLLSKNSSESWEVSISVDGTNTPTSTSVTSKSISVTTSLAGKTCKLRLSCYYKSGNSIEGPQKTSVFDSNEFLVAGYPDPPEYMYPGVRDFTTCNLTPRIIFKVSNPDYLDDKDIYDIRIVVRSGSDSKTYTFKNHSNRFFDKNGVISTSKVPNGTFVSFTLDSSSSDRTIQVYCTNAYLECKDPSVCISTYSEINYPVKGSVLSNKGHREVLYTRVREVINGYKKVNGNKGLDAVESTTYPPVIKSFCIPILNLLKSSHEAVLQYSPSRDSDINIGGIDTSTEHPPVVTDTEEFGITLGNFFSDIYYILKNML